MSDGSGHYRNLKIGLSAELIAVLKIIASGFNRATAIVMDATTISVEAGMNDATPCGYLEEHARERGEDSVIAIQDALILSQGLNDPTPFQRVMRQLPPTLCHDLPKQKTRAKKTG
jgi:hypothetical protein